MRVLTTLFAGIAAVGILLGFLASRALAEDPGGGRTGSETDVQEIQVRKNSAHADLECSECHVGTDSPRKGQKLQPVRCAGCHQDEAGKLKGASHYEKLKALLGEKGAANPSQECLSCHGSDAHNVLSAKDASSPTNRSHVSAMCLNCHKEGQTIEIGAYSDSVHAAAIGKGDLKAAACIDCHGSHAIDHSGLPVSRVFHSSVPDTCGQCHEDELRAYEGGKHRIVAKKGFREAPVCTDCHGEHGIRSRQDPQSPVWVGNITKTCAACHASEKLVSKFKVAPARVESFEDSFHGLSGELGDLRVANCSSCHGNHAILPSSDPRSSVNPQNLGRTCGRCHPGAAQQFTAERIHSTQAQPAHWLVDVVRQFYVWTIALTLGGMLVHNLLDVSCKAIRGIPYHRSEELDPRFTIGERTQHALLALSFVLLAVSGFALKFPNSPFAWPFHWLSDGPHVRRLLHRGAALLFGGVAVYHVLYILLSARGRKQLRLLLPGLHDVRDFRGVLQRYFSSFQHPLRLRHHTYVEKFEYWALVWGSVVMTTTGLVLFFCNVALANLPFWTIEIATAIHFWEALLACLAILVWHGYWVVFDPEIYPLNLTWLLGNPRPKGDRSEQEAPLEGTAG